MDGGECEKTQTWRTGRGSTLRDAWLGMTPYISLAARGRENLAITKNCIRSPILITPVSSQHKSASGRLVSHFRVREPAVSVAPSRNDPARPCREGGKRGKVGHIGGSRPRHMAGRVRPGRSKTDPATSPETPKQGCSLARSISPPIADVRLCVYSLFCLTYLCLFRPAHLLPLRHNTSAVSTPPCSRHPHVAAPLIMPVADLRVLAGPSPHSLTDISDRVNTSRTHRIVSDTFEGDISLQIKRFPTHRRTTSSDYFERLDRQGITWSIQVQGLYILLIFPPNPKPTRS